MVLLKQSLTKIFKKNSLLSVSSQVNQDFLAKFRFKGIADAFWLRSIIYTSIIENYIMLVLGIQITR